MNLKDDPIFQLIYRAYRIGKRTELEAKNQPQVNPDPPKPEADPKNAGSVQLDPLGGQP